MKSSTAKNVSSQKGFFTPVKRTKLGSCSLDGTGSVLTSGAGVASFISASVIFLCPKVVVLESNQQPTSCKHIFQLTFSVIILSKQQKPWAVVVKRPSPRSCWYVCVRLRVQNGNGMFVVLRDKDIIKFLGFNELTKSLYNPASSVADGS
jgi:hypothetical protein